MADDAINLSIADLNTSVNHEPRIRDLKLAEKLGMTDAHAIRRIIERNRAELEGYGEVSATVAETTAGLSDAASENRKRGRPGREYWLNEGQALVICALSRTPAAAAVRRQIIDLFMAYRRGAFSEPRADGPPYFPSCDADPQRQPPPRPLPPPPEPPICAGCAAKALINPGMDQAYHPLADGPLTASELAFIVLLRGEMKKRETAMRRDISNELIRRLAAGIADGGGQ